jgi:hypothetical protein
MNRIDKPVGQLLHNMSVAPQTVIAHHGGDQRTYGKALVFRMPDLDGHIDSAQILALLDDSPSRCRTINHRMCRAMSRFPGRIGVCIRQRIVRQLPTAANAQQVRAPACADAERELRQRISAHALTLPLPKAAVVTESHLAGDRVCDDLLSVVTVLAKSSGHVYLRDKEPNLAAIRPGRRVVLLLPPPWSLP